MTKKELRCVHRHSIKTHPHCFATGNVIYKNDKDFSKETGKAWYEYPGYKIGYLDIESDGLKADWGTMLSWCIKTKGDTNIYSDRITKEDLFSGAYDKRLVKSLIDRMLKYNIIVTYFGTNFDIPFVRTKALHYGLEFPSYGDVYHFDLFYTVKAKFCLSSKSLDNTCQYFGIKGKTPIDKDVWRAAKYGDAEALELVIEHNKGDVIILEALHDKVDFTRKWIKRSI